MYGYANSFVAASCASIPSFISPVYRVLFIPSVRQTPAKRTTQWRTQEFFSVGGGSTNSAEDRGQREGGSGGTSPLVRRFTQFVIE
jgi:hypothetical protein